MLLRENEKTTLLETLRNTFETDGELPKEFQKAIMDMIMSNYLDLVYGKIKKEDIDQIKKRVTTGLLFMLDEVNKIGN